MHLPLTNYGRQHYLLSTLTLFLNHFRIFINKTKSFFCHFFQFSKFYRPLFAVSICMYFPLVVRLFCKNKRKNLNKICFSVLNFRRCRTAHAKRSQTTELNCFAIFSYFSPQTNRQTVSRRYAFFHFRFFFYWGTFALPCDGGLCPPSCPTVGLLACVLCAVCFSNMNSKSNCFQMRRHLVLWISYDFFYLLSFAVVIVALPPYYWLLSLGEQYQQHI